MIPPHGRRAVYCHSGLPDDLGIQYQSYSKKAIVGQDEYVTLHPGLGHTGSEPFDDQHGWYRAHRGLAGSISYSMRWKGWNCHEHNSFPEALRETVRTILLCHYSAYRQHQRLLTVENGHSQGLVTKRSADEFYEMEDECTNGKRGRSSSPVHSTSSMYPGMVIAGESVNGLVMATNSTRIPAIHTLPVHVVYYIMEFMVSLPVILTLTACFCNDNS